MEQDIHEALGSVANDIKDMIDTGFEESHARFESADCNVGIQRRICRNPSIEYADKLGQPYYEASVSIKGIPLLFDTGACVMWDFDLDKLVERLHEVINRHEELELTRQQQVE
jgi:hypothetical protein